MLDLLEFVVKNIVKNKEDVKIESKEDGRVKVFTVRVNKADIGAVIGKGGATAQAIRTVAKSMNSRERVIIKFDSLD